MLYPALWNSAGAAAIHRASIEIDIRLFGDAETASRCLLTGGYCCESLWLRSVSVRWTGHTRSTAPDIGDDYGHDSDDAWRLHLSGSDDPPPPSRAEIITRMRENRS
jgi:hypothetical protein